MNNDDSVFCQHNTFLFSDLILLHYLLVLSSTPVPERCLYLSTTSPFALRSKRRTFWPAASFTLAETLMNSKREPKE